MKNIFENFAKIILPPLHIKLGLMRYFVRVMDRSTPQFAFLKIVFLSTDAKIVAGKLNLQHKLALKFIEFIKKTEKSFSFYSCQVCSMVLTLTKY